MRKETQQPQNPLLASSAYWQPMQKCTQTNKLLMSQLLGNGADLQQVGFRHCRNVFSRLPHSVLQTCSLALSGVHKGPCFVDLMPIFIIVSFYHPLLQQGLHLTCFLVTELLRLKGADGCLVKHLPKENPQGKPHIGLGIS